MKWNDATRELIMETTNQIIADGMTRPPIRAVLYRLLSFGWSKDHYNRLCSMLGKWRDQGLIRFGIFSDESGGSRERPYSRQEIQRQIENWKKTTPYKLPKDGFVHVLLIEHIALVNQISEWFDGQAIVASSQGQLRRENLWTAANEWKYLAMTYKAKGIIVHGMFDYDKGGQDIAGAHSRWLRNIMNVGFVNEGLNEDQLEQFNLPIEDTQLDGAFGLDPRWWRQYIGQMLGIQE